MGCSVHYGREMFEVRSNVFAVQTEVSQGVREKNNVKNLLIAFNGARQYFSWGELEDASRKLGIKKKEIPFYNLCPTVWSEVDGPAKLCGLGVKTLMGAELYDKFYESCIQLLSVDFKTSSEDVQPSTMVRRNPV